MTSLAAGDRPAAAKPMRARIRTAEVMFTPESAPAATAADEALAGLLARGDHDALAELYRRHGAACYRLARRVTASTALAEDAVQEAFLGAWRGAGYQPDLGTVRTWLLGLAHHKAVDAVRRQAAWHRRQDAAAAQEALAPVPEDDPAALAVQSSRAAEIRAAVADLPEAQREALILAYFGGYTQSEIAGLTGVPLGTVKTRTLAAMRRLRLRLAPMAADAGEEGAG
jgi:RNA polymerase sigma-70 factor (ECF subfamily)